MTQTEHLAKIRAKCVGLLDRNDYGGYCSAGWRSTIAAIDLIPTITPVSDKKYHTAEARAIIAAWPEELL